MRVMGTSTTRPIGSRSVLTSYFNVRYKAGAIEMPICISKRVYPSFGAATTRPTPMVPPAPPTFSTITVWPSDFDITPASVRATVSVGPPATKGTTIVTGLAGYACAPATLLNANTPIAKKILLNFMHPPEEAVRRLSQIMRISILSEYIFLPLSGMFAICGCSFRYNPPCHETP